MDGAPNPQTTQTTRAGEHGSLLPPWAFLPLYLGFAATGVGVALPGATLPALLLRWHMSDAQGGRLFLLAWIGSSVGSLVVNGRLRTTLIFGCLGIACGATGLAYGTGTAAGAALWMALFGAGLGLAMTSISLLCEDGIKGSGKELIRLNFLWAVGACLCPTLAERALRLGDVRPLLGGVAAVFSGLAVWAGAQARLSGYRVDTTSAWTWGAIRSVPLRLAGMTMLVTGVEASAGGWLATYSRRGGAGLVAVIAAPTCLWAGLLLSRLLWGVRTAPLSVQAVVRGSVALMAAAAILLLAGSGWTLPIAAFCLGCGIGPVYPLLLAAVLQYTRSGGIFFLAGIGAACLPWLTGVVATARGSLQMGLLVPVAATFILLALSWTGPRTGWSRSPDSA